MSVHTQSISSAFSTIFSCNNKKSRIATGLNRKQKSIIPTSYHPFLLFEFPMPYARQLGKEA